MNGKALNLAPTDRAASAGRQFGSENSAGTTAKRRTIMAYVTHSARPAAASHVAASLEKIAAWIAGMRSAFARRKALHELAALTDYRLDDIGLSRQDLQDARKVDLHNVTILLAERRDRRSRDWRRSR
jgi:uncharacterized protein YjiS (DUF1127 family)